MDVALVEHAEDEVDDDQRGQDQQRHGGERLLERLRVALEGRRRAWPACRARASRFWIALGRLAERDARRQVEADRDRRELALVADRQRRDRRRRPFGEALDSGTWSPVVGDLM